jgi:hypothetical protein
MNRDSDEGLRLRQRFEDDLREWGWFNACEKALEMMPVGLPRLCQFQSRLKTAESALFKSRYAYADHMAHCIVCSRKLITPNAIPEIQERLKRVVEQSSGESHIKVEKQDC